MVRRLAILAGAVIGLACGPAWAGPCAKSLAPSRIAGSDGYTERDGGQRCEGIYVSPVAGESVQIVSLTRGPLSFDASEAATLSVTLAVIPSDTAPVHVRAVGIPERLYYQMDADLPARGALSWPLGEVVQRERIAPVDIGIYAFHAGAGSTVILLPVLIATPGRPAVATQPLITIFRVQAVASPRWRFIPAGGAASAYTPARIDDNRISLVLPADIRLPGQLDLGWDEAGSGTSHVTSFKIGD